ncbi:MAG: FkbM family methyltransferase [Cyclobacteriaceae bacterium]|nr:FkbM family methyltransferase [Cyclobacteriaceae bacterium]
MQLAPIILFVYNRYEHTNHTLVALKANRLIHESELIIYSDGPKTPKDFDAVEKVRKLIKNIDWVKNLVIIERASNMGLADNIVEGVTKTLEKYSKAIILEDDIITSSGFLEYMNSALDLYETEEKVMHISGYMFPVKGKLPNTFFYNTASCWGWGTWKRAWEHFQFDSTFLLRTIREKNLINEFNLDGAYNFFKDLEANTNGIKKTWAVLWYASMFLKNGYSLHPYPSLTNNIGHDGTGVNCHQNDIFSWKNLPESLVVEKIKLEQSKEARKLMKIFYKSINKKTLIDWIKKCLKKIPIVRKVIPLLLREEYREKILLKRIINKLNKIRRYEKGSIKLFGKKVEYTDSASTKFIISEIFIQEIYKFKPKQEKPYIIDAGANIGLSSIYFKRNFPESKIIAFEPDPDVFSILRQNLNSFGFNDVDIINKALWKHDGILSFMKEGADAGRLSLDGRSNFQVDCVRLSSYIDRPVDLLKIDIEGSEVEVLYEIANQLNNIDHLFIEYHSFANKKQQLGKILSLLELNGFRYHISNVSYQSKFPFIEKRIELGMDLQVNIYAKRVV